MSLLALIGEEVPRLKGNLAHHGWQTCTGGLPVLKIKEWRWREVVWRDWEKRSKHGKTVIEVEK